MCKWHFSFRTVSLNGIFDEPVITPVLLMCIVGGEQETCTSFHLLIYMFAKRTFSIECFPVNDGTFHQLGPGGSFQASSLKDPSLLICTGFIGSQRKLFRGILKAHLLQPLPQCAEVLGVFCCQCVGVA